MFIRLRMEMLLNTECVLFEVEKEPSKSYSLRKTVHTGWSVNVYDVYKRTLFDLPGEKTFFNKLFGWVQVLQ